MITRLLRIHGRVQGVWFRDSMRRKAEQLGVTGWVRNRRDGTVEAIVQGDSVAIEAIIAWAHRGPPDAEVHDLRISPADGLFDHFEQRETC